MASDNEASCASDPNFAVICSFLECFGKSCGIVCPDIARLQEMLENTQEVPQQLIDLHIKLLRKIRKTVSPEKWERALVKFCHSYSNQDGWELERFGYKKARIAVKLRLLKVLLETQFDLNQKFKNEVNKLAAHELRVEPLGRDKVGLAYWCQLDEECNIRVYREDLDEENWELVAKDREGVVSLIGTLSNGEAGDIPINEDSNSLEISEKPIIDTGQVTTSPSLEDETVQENGVHADASDDKELDKSGVEDFGDEQDDANEADNDEDDMEPEDDMTNDESSKQNTEEDESQEVPQNVAVGSTKVDSAAPSLTSVSTPAQIVTDIPIQSSALDTASSLPPHLPLPRPSESQVVSKTLNGKVETQPTKEDVPLKEKGISPPVEAVNPVALEVKPVAISKNEDPPKTSHGKIETEEPVPVKSIETPVITSPLKLVNIAELKQAHEEKALQVAPLNTSLNVIKVPMEDTSDSIMRSLEKLSGKNNLTFTPTEMPMSKLSVKPIDQLAANLVRIQSDKLEKTNPAKSLEKIAENLARTGSLVGSVVNGDDDRLAQDFCTRSQMDKANVLRGHRGMDLSTSPRGWENVTEQNRPVDFSGMDLSSRKFNKPVDLPSPGYRTQDFQQREMDLSTKKVNKPDVPNLPYDARAVMMRNHAMVADLSKRQMPFTPYEMASPAYHNSGRIPVKDEHRLSNYTLLSDPSKIAALRMSGTSMKRPMETDDGQQDILKRIRADVIPIRGSMDKRPMMQNNWRDEVSEAIEEPVMMVQGEGSGSDCDAVNPGLSEAIEEPTMFFHGEGSGQECDTGNPGEDASADNKESNESKTETDSASASLSPNKTKTEDSLMNEVSAESIVNKSTVKLSRNYPQSTVKDNCQVVGSTQEKPKFKPTLGIQIIPKSVTGSVKRLSRWDVGRPEETSECDKGIISNEGDISPKKNACDYEVHDTPKNLPPTEIDPHQNEIGYDDNFSSCSSNVHPDASVVNAVDTTEDQNIDEVCNVETKAKDETASDEKAPDSTQCDSTLSLCPADTSEEIVSCTQTVIKTSAGSGSDTMENTSSIEETSCSTANPESVDNECKFGPSSPPRFFFGPNCISYTSKSDEAEMQSDTAVTSSMHSKQASLEYECVSSSKPVENIIASVKSDDFDISRTNNNSLKVNSFASQSDDEKEAENTQGPSDAWDQTVSPNVNVEEQHCIDSKLETSRSESKVEAEEDAQSSTIQDPVSSSESMEVELVQSKEDVPNSSAVQPHRTTDLSSFENKVNLDTNGKSGSMPASIDAYNISVAEPAPSGDVQSSNIVEACEHDVTDTPDNTDNVKESAVMVSGDGDCKPSNLETHFDNIETQTTTEADVSSSPILETTAPKEAMDIVESENEETPSGSAEKQEVSSSETLDIVEEDPKNPVVMNDNSESVEYTKTGSSIESCNKEKTRSDDFSEVHQEELPSDVNSGKTESASNSNIDLPNVSLDKNVESADLSLDTSEQEESRSNLHVSEDDQNSPFTKDSVSRANADADIDNSVVTSSEAVQKSENEALVPTISSSDDACTSQKSIDVDIHLDDTPDDGSAVKKYSAYDMLPAAVPDANLSDPCKFNTESVNEANSSCIDEIADKEAEVTVQPKGFCEGPNTSAETIPQEKLPESSELSEEIEESMISEEKYTASTPDADSVFPPVPGSRPSSEEDLINESLAVPKPDKQIETTSVYVNEGLSSKQERQLIVDRDQSKTEDSQCTSTENPEYSATTEIQGTAEIEGAVAVKHVKSTDDLQKQPNAIEDVAPKLDQGDSTILHPLVPAHEINQSSLVDYTSGSDDASDDVFETQDTKSCDVKSNAFPESVELSKREESLAPEVSEKQESTQLDEDVQNTVGEEQQVEPKTENQISETDSGDEIKHEQKSHVRQYLCNNISNTLHDKLTAVGAETRKEEADTFSVPDIIDSKPSDVSAALKPIETSVCHDAHSAEVGHQVNKEYVNTTFVTMNNRIELNAEDSNNGSIAELSVDYSTQRPAENNLNFDNEKKDVREITYIERSGFSETKDNINFKNINSQISVLRSSDEVLKSTDEKLTTGLDLSSNYVTSGDAKEQISRELPVELSFKKQKELSEFGHTENKVEMKLSETYNIIKAHQDDSAVHSLQSMLPLKTDNTSSGLDATEMHENYPEIKPENYKPVDNINFINCASGKSEDLKVGDNHDQQNELINLTKKIETHNRNALPLLKEARFATKESLPEPRATENDFKREISEKHSDIPDIPRESPLQPKLECVTSGKNLTEKSESSEPPLFANAYIPKQEEISAPEKEDAPHLIKPAEIDVKAEIKINNDVPDIKSSVEEAVVRDTEESKESVDIHSVEVKEMLTSDDSMGVDNESAFNPLPEDETDPLAVEDEAVKKLTNLADDPDTADLGIRVETVNDTAYEGWKLDSTEPPKLSRKRRNSSHESNSEDGTVKYDGEEMIGAKRIKLRGKRTPDKELRKAVEERREGTLSSEDEAGKGDGEQKVGGLEGKDISDDQNAAQLAANERKARGRPRGRRRRGGRSGRSNRPKHSEFQGSQTSEISPGVHPDGTPSNDSSLGMTPTAQRKRKKRKMVLGLEIGRDIVPEVQAASQDETPVRQSRRIAQLKIKEEADRRRIEEETLSELKEKKEQAEKKKRKKPKHESEEEVVIKEIEKEKKSKKKRRKRKKKKMQSKFNESNPWQSSSGSSSDDDNENDDDEEEEEEESEGSLLFKSDHEFSPESDLEKDQESEPLRRARTAQKAQSDVEEADDEYACQKCSKADHPEWILLCDSCDKGWHCSCLRPALMLIPEGDWFCPPCQHNLLVTKLRDSLKTYDQVAKRHENELLRKKRLAFVGISLDNVLHKSESPRTPKESKDDEEEESSQDSDNDSSSSSTESSTESSSSEGSEPVYQLRERRCANTYKFNEYDDMINAAIQDEVEAVQGAGNQGRGKDIATIVNAEKEEAQLHFQAEEDVQEMQDEKEEVERKSEKDSDEDFKLEREDLDEEEEERKSVARKLLARKKHRKLNSLDISSEDDPESDEDFKGTSSEEEEDFDDHITSSDESSLADIKRRGKRGDSRPVRRSTRARMTRYDEEFINDDSEESDRPKRKKSRSMWGESDSEDSDNSWRQRKKKSRTMPTSRSRTVPKIKSKKKKKRKRIIESDNQSDNEDEEEPGLETQAEPIPQVQPQSPLQPHVPEEGPMLHGVLDVKLDNNINTENNGASNNTSDLKDIELVGLNTDIPSAPTVLHMAEPVPQKKKKDTVPKPKKAPGIRRKIIYGGLPDENRRQEEEETLGRRTRGRKINYQEEIASDSEEELKKALRKTGESEDEFVVNEGDDINDDAEKDSDSGDIYNPRKEGPKFKNKSPKTRKPRKSPGGKRKSMSDGAPKQRKKPGPKPGSKNKARKQKFAGMGSVIKARDDPDADVMAHVMDNPIGDMESKMDDNLPDNVGLTGTTMSVGSSFTGDVPEGSLTGLGPGELADLDDEQLEQMMMEEEEYGRRQLELAAIEIAKKKKKEEREAKKLEKARQKALEILAAERQRDPNAPEGLDGEAPKKKKRGRRSKAEILAEQMRRDGAPNLGATNLTATVGLATAVTSTPPAALNPTLAGVMTPDAERTSDAQIPMMTGPDGQLFNPDGTPMKPKRRGRGSSTSGSAPSTPPAGVVTAQGPPATQTSNAQSVYPSLPPNQQSSVITRMLQSQPVSSTPQSFTAAAAAMGHKYFGAPNAAGQMIGGPRTGYEMQPRGRIPSPYRQTGQATMPPHFAAVRSGTPPMRMRVPGAQMYHTSHHPMDPSPSGGGPISINNRDRSSPLGPGPAMIPPAAGSPLAKGGPTPPPPPPPYVRGAPPMARFTDNPMGPRHQMPPFTNASPASHNLQQPSPPPNRPPGNFSPYHPPPPPNYHYGAYPPPPPLSTADDAAAYQGSPYSAEHFSSPADNPPPIQAPPPPQGPPQQGHPTNAGPGNKQYDEEGTGEFGGLVSYFSSQREDDLDS